MDRMKALMKVALVALPLAALCAAASAAEYEIVIDKMKFGVAPVDLKVGDVIVWRNDDMFRHTATARDKSFDVDLPPKKSARMTIEQAGAIDYFCRFHPGMVGKLEVRP